MGAQADRAAVPAAAAEVAGPVDVRAAIAGVPGLRVVEEKPAAPGFRFFVLALQQPNEHHHLERGGFEQRFFPQDVAGSVAYSAPNNVDDREDSAYLDFLRTVGTPECRGALEAAQRALLERREALVARYRAWADARGDGFGLVGGADRALEIAVLRAPFMFWRGRGQAACPAVPAPDVSDDALYGWLSDVAQLPVYADSVANQFVPYFYQLGTQLGYFPVETDHLSDLLRHPGATEPRSFVPRDVPLRHRPQAMRDVDRWVRTDGERLMFVNGGADPSVAEPFRLGRGSRDSYVFQVPGGTHSVRISQLPSPDATAASATLRRWAGV